VRYVYRAYFYLYSSSNTFAGIISTLLAIHVANFKIVALGRVDKVWEAMGFWATATGS
jgi:hypothetical protein